MSFHAGQITSLPDNLFNQLPNLTYLSLSGSHPTSLLDGIKWPTTLTSLGLYSTQLSTLPDGVFAGLPSLTTLNLNNNNLTSLPPDIFSELPNLTTLVMRDNQLSTLPDALFSGRTSLTTLRLSGNSVDPLPLTVSLEKVADGQFKAVAPTGAPFDIVLPIRVRNGSIKGGSITIPKGSVESGTLTVTRAAGTTFAVTVDIGTLPGLPTDVVYNQRLHNGYTLVKSADLPLAFTELGGQVLTPVAERTPQVREGIRGVVRLNDPSVSSFADITETHLAGVTTLSLNNKNITSLRSGDFDGLTGLEELRLNDNQIATLPAGIFDGLSSLTTLHLNNGSLTSLLEDVFEGLSSLINLDLSFNQLNTLPRSIFSDLGSLRNLNMVSNAFNSLPVGIFSGLSFDTLGLSFTPGSNLFTSSPGLFSGMGSLGSFTLSPTPFTFSIPGGAAGQKGGDNEPDSLPLTVSLEKVADGQFKATAPTGAPFDIVLSLNVTNGTINGGATTITIPAGSVESDPLTVTRTSGTTPPVTVDIGTLPELPTSHQGYELVKSTDLPLEIFSRTATQVIAVNIPDSNLRAKIESALGKTSGATISATEMATLTTLTAQDASITDLTGLETATNLTTVKLGNNTISNISALSGLTSLTELHLWDNQLSNISALAGLTNLTRLYLWGNSISDISHLSGLTNLTHLRLGENSISNISAVSSLRNLTYLSVKENAISNISAVSGLTNLTELLIGNNTISDITPVRNLTNLTWLDMPNNQISDISAVRNLTKLVELYFQNNAASDLSPLVANTGLGTDDELYVRGNPLSYPSIYTHIPALQARDVYIDFDNRVATASLKISGDTQQGPPSTALAQPFVVEVQDGSSVAFAEVPVTFAVTAGGGTLSTTNTTTDANGRAESVLTLGNTAGTNTVTVSVQGISQTATFTATAAATDIVSLSPISNRTSQVRVAIVEAVPGVNSAADVTEKHLAAITSLDLSSKNITSLQAGDFDGLTALTNLNLSGNGHSIRVPSGIFDKLTELTHLNLNRTGALWGWSGFFDKLTNLTHLYMHQSDFASYNFAGIFDKNTGLTHLYLSYNGLTSLPVNIFAKNTKLIHLDLHFNDFSSLPDGIFDNLTALTSLDLSGNAVNPMPLIVSLERVAEGQFKAVAPTGAPFDIALPLSITNGSISGSATNITIPKGSVESVSLSVTRTPGTTAAVTVNIGTLPGLPPNHTGYTLVKSDALPLEVTNDGSGNRDPVFTANSTTRTIAENTAAGVNIGTPVAATDADNDTLTYTLGGTDANAFNIERTTGQLRTRATLDYETKRSYTVTVTVSDGGLTDTITVTINVTDVAETPANTGVCQVGDILSPGESCTYPGTDAEFSVLNNGNGQFLFFSSGNSLNIRNTTINGVSYTLVANKLASGSWEIEEIADSTAPVTTNTAPTFTEGASTTRSVAENTSANVNIGNAVAATDPENDTLTYTLSGTDAASFDIESTTGQLKTKSALDYETKSTYTVTITVSDSNLTDTITVTINVTNIAETSKATTAINIPDNNLRAKIETALGKTSGGPISLAEMATLTSLTAQDASISNLTGLETATNLTTLKIGDNAVSDISALAGLTNLTELQLWDNQISNISILASLTSLTKLYIWGNAISDISALAGLTNLTQLKLSENTISNISILSRLTNLTELSLTKNAISDISALAGLTNLTELRIGNNTIANISAVAKLTNLVWLDAPNNSISDISAVANLTNLTSLMLTGNTTSDISTLTGLTKLIELYLGENSVSDISPLTANTGLGNNTEIDVRGNPLSYPSIYTHIPALQARDVYIDFDNRVATAPLKISGDTQQGAPSTALANPLVVEVQDANSVVFAGVPVTFAVTAGGGTLSVTSTTTNTNGRAESTLILGSSAGTNTVRVSVQGVSQAATFTAEATTTNTAPVFTDGSSTTRTIAENTAAGINIGATIAATDANNDTLTYALGGTDAASFSISSSTGQLQTKSALDYETKSTYTVTVTVSDGTLTDSITVTINITDVAETPANTGVCQVGDVLAPGESCTYPSTAATFSVHNNGNGQFLFFTSGSNLNIKNTVINGQSYTLVANKLASGSWKIEEIADSAAPATTNTAPVFTEGASTTRTIAENTAAGVNIGTAVAATDADNDTLTYTLGGTDASTFDIDSTTGQLQTKASLDYETKRSYTVTITVSDGSLTDTITVTINITDVAETPVVPTLNLLSDRTPQVRDAIVSAIPGISSANDVTEAHLKTITSLDLNDKSITSLKAGDFNGLSSLRTLYLNDNQLTSLPSNLFSGLITLKDLYLNNNQLTSLPVDLFAGLSSLRQINLHTN